MPERKLRVFLCHASQDKPVVRELYQRLLAEGWIDPWLDEKRLLPGMDWDLEIEKAVEIADAVIICLSKSSVAKEGYVQKEVQKVLDISSEKPEGTIYIIPVRFDNCEPPRRLTKWQYMDYFQNSQNNTATELILESLRIRANILGILVDVDVDDVSVLQICPFCYRDIRSSDAYIQCGKCGVYSHRECWNSFGGCMTIDCENNPDNRKMKQLKEMESKAIQFELIGKWWDALQIYYRIKKIDPNYPRVDIKINDLEREYSKSKHKITGGVYLCPQCHSYRSMNLSEPCPNCSSRKTIFGYRYPWELQKIRIILAIAVGLAFLIMIALTMFLIDWFPELLR